MRLRCRFADGYFCQCARWPPRSSQYARTDATSKFGAAGSNYRGKHSSSASRASCRKAQAARLGTKRSGDSAADALSKASLNRQAVVILRRHDTALQRWSTAFLRVNLLFPSFGALSSPGLTESVKQQGRRRMDLWPVPSPDSERCRSTTSMSRRKFALGRSRPK